MEKKIFIICIVLTFICSGCSKKIDKKEIEIPFQNVEEKMEVPVNPISIGIYTRQNGKRVLTKEYTSSFVLNKDVGVFSSFYTIDENISGGNMKDVWNQYFHTYRDIDSYKIGYFISFEVKNGERVSKTILKPEDAYSFYDYMQVYLYDDVHQEDGAFYTHIEKMLDNTLLTSIKLTGSTLTHEITSPIMLTSFTYKDVEDFDELTGEYKGNSFFQTMIYKKE